MVAKSLIAVVALAAAVVVGVLYYGKIHGGIAIRDGRLHFRPANVSFAMLEAPWQLVESKQIEQGDLVVFFEHTAGQGKVYVNIAPVNKENKLTLDIVRQRSFDKMKAMGYRRTARSPSDQTFFFIGKDGDIVGFFFSQLADSHILSTYCSGGVDVFPTYRKQWLALIQSFEPPLNKNGG